MKKTLVIMSAVALAMFGFSSCEKPEGPDVENIIEDGFYVTGPATGLESLDSKAMMSIAVDENHGNKKVDGLFEKYIVLDADKEFAITSYSAGAETPMGAKLEKKNVNGKDDQIKNDFFTGKVDASLKMKVAETGLYHVIYYKPLSDIYVIPVKWGVRGVNGDWGWKEMKASAVNHETMTWTIEYKDGIKAGEFKFAHSDGWKLEIDPSKQIKINTNLGENMEPGGSNILMPPYKKNSKIVLTWSFVKGAVSKAYEMKMVGETDVVDVKTITAGLAGDAFKDLDVWNGTPKGKLAGVYNEKESKVVDAAKMIGTLVFDLKDLEIIKDKDFKVIYCGAWKGAKDKVKAEGIKHSGDDNIKVAEGGKYDVKIIIDWKAGLANGITVKFIKK